MIVGALVGCPVGAAVVGAAVVGALVGAVVGALVGADVGTNDDQGFGALWKTSYVHAVVIAMCRPVGVLRVADISTAVHVVALLDVSNQSGCDAMK
jgi:hypothetical protein